MRASGVALLALAAACGRLVSIEDRPCPCADGYVCCAALGRCVTDLASCPAVAPGGPDAAPDGAIGDADAGIPCPDRSTPRTALDPGAWSETGNDVSDYLMTADTTLTVDRLPSAHIRSKSPSAPPTSQFATMMGNVSAAPYLGRRVRYTAIVISKQITGWGGLWLRVDGPNGKTLALAGMAARPVIGDVDGNRYEVTVDVDPSAEGLAFGVELNGPGEIWASNNALEVPEPGAAYEVDPSAWLVSGTAPADYVIGTDSNVTRCARPSGHIASRATSSGFGTLTQTVAADDYLGKRLRMSGYVRGSSLHHAALWMRVDDDAGNILVIDNMGNRLITGTSDWTRYEIVVDVASSARSIPFGMLSEGDGEAWVDAVKLEVVDSSVPTTAN